VVSVLVRIADSGDNSLMRFEAQYNVVKALQVKLFGQTLGNEFRKVFSEAMSRPGEVSRLARSTGEAVLDLALFGSGQAEHKLGEVARVPPHNMTMFLSIDLALIALANPDDSMMANAEHSRQVAEVVDRHGASPIRLMLELLQWLHHVP
jgi:hypothetical protein